MMKIICTAIELATFVVAFAGSLFVLAFCTMMAIGAAHSLIEHLIEKGME